MEDIRKSRLSQSKQSKLMEYFVSGTPAKCAASLVSINKSPASYYFHRLREIIAYQIADKPKKPLAAKLKLMRVTLAGIEKVREAEALAERHLFLGS